MRMTRYQLAGHMCCMEILSCLPTDSTGTRISRFQRELSLAMNNDQRTAYVLRDGILDLLSDEEVARVQNVETADQLSEGDEYIDLGRLDQGVHRAQGAFSSLGRVLPRNAVHQDTWSKILMQLTRLYSAGPELSEPLPTPRNT
jgi:hypothetical protein